MVYLFEKQKNWLIAFESGEDRKTLQAALKSELPAQAMTAGELKAHIDKITKPINDEKAKVSVDGWKLEEKKKTGNDPSYDEYS